MKIKIINRESFNCNRGGVMLENTPLTQERIHENKVSIF